MSYSVNPKELAAVFALPPQERMAYFVAKVAGWGELWSVGNAEGWALMETDTGCEVVPVWPAHAFAAACCIDGFSDCIPSVISLDDWMVKWLKGMQRDGRRVALFPLPNDTGLVLNPDIIEQVLSEALRGLVPDDDGVV